MLYKVLDETNHSETGSFEIGKRTGRKRKTSKTDDRRIGILAKKDPRATLRYVKDIKIQSIFLVMLCLRKLSVSYLLHKQIFTLLFEYGMNIKVK